jgi:hypothetical protein
MRYPPIGKTYLLVGHKVTERLYVPTATMNYITVCDKVSMPANGGTTCRFMRPRALQPPTIQLGNSGIDPPAQVPQRDIIDAQMAFFGRLHNVEIELLAA